MENDRYAQNRIDMTKLVREYRSRSVSAQRRSEIIEIILDYYKFQIYKCKQQAPFNDHEMIDQLARVRIHEALRRFKQGRGASITTYMQLWLRGVRKDYSRFNCVCKLKDRHIYEEEAREMLEAYTAANNLPGHSEDDISVHCDATFDMRSLLDGTEQHVVIHSAAGYNDREISCMLALSRDKINTLREQIKLKVTMYMSTLGDIYAGITGANFSSIYLAGR